VASYILEELVIRERIREWKYQGVALLHTALQTYKTPDLVDKLISSSDEMFSMVMHREGAYDLTDKPEKSSAEKKDLLTPDVKKYFEMLDRLEDA
jgi:hypothetical protein